MANEPQGYRSKRAKRAAERKKDKLAREQKQSKERTAHHNFNVSIREEEASALKADELAYVKEMLTPGISPGEAARRAGISSIPTRELVRETILDLRQRQLEQVDVTPDMLVLQLARFAMHDMRRAYDLDGKLLPPTDWDNDFAAGIGGIDVEQRTERNGPNREDVETYHIVKIRTKPSVQAAVELLKYLTQGGGRPKNSDKLKELISVFNAGPVKRK